MSDGLITRLMRPAIAGLSRSCARDHMKISSVSLRVITRRDISDALSVYEPTEPRCYEYYYQVYMIHYTRARRKRARTVVKVNASSLLTFAN